MNAQKISPADSAVNAIKLTKNDSVRMESYCDYIRANRHSQHTVITVAKSLLQEAQQNNSDNFKVRAYKFMAIAYQELRDVPRSLECYLEALRIYKTNNQYEKQIVACVDISVLYDMVSDFEKMKAYSDEAWKICQDHKIYRYQAYVLDREATIDKIQGKLELAIRKYESAITIARQYKDTMGEVASLCNMAIALKSSKEYPRSLRAYQQSLQLIDTNRDIYAYSVLLDNMAILFYEMGDYRNSEEYAFKALALERKTNDRAVDVDIFEVLKNVYTKEKKYPEALEYFGKWVAVKDSLLDKEKSQQIKELQAKYDIKEKDEQIALQGKEITYTNKITSFLVVSSFMLLSIGGIVFRNQRKTGQLNKLILSQKQELEQLNDVKDRILSVIGHDMRSPVHSLIAFAQLLENKNISPEELSEYSGLLKTNLTYTASLMENLLNWARSQMQGYKPVLESFDIALVAKQVVGLLQHDAAGKGVKIIDQVKDNTIVYADSNMSELLLRNLLSNAVKYTADGGTVTLSVHTLGDKILIDVRDTGTGMDEEMVARFNSSTGITQPLSSKAGTANEKGTGLGLMLCKNFANLMNGNLTVFSVRGNGACFTVELPATPSANAA